jgi:hypothetical protein
MSEFGVTPDRVDAAKAKVKTGVSQILGTGGWAVQPKPAPVMRPGRVVPMEAPPAESVPISIEKAKEAWALMDENMRNLAGEGDFNIFWNRLQDAEAHASWEKNLGR